MTDRIDFRPDARLLPDQAHALVCLQNGETMEAHVEHCRGGPDRQMTEDELGAKFLSQAAPVLGSKHAKDLLGALLDIPARDDVAAHLCGYLNAHRHQQGT
jgi:hypothetical protein